MLSSTINMVKACGLIWGIGGGPFLVQKMGRPLIGVDVEYECLHWATRIEGLQSAWQEDTKHDILLAESSSDIEHLYRCTHILIIYIKYFVGTNII